MIISDSVIDSALKAAFLSGDLNIDTEIQPSLITQLIQNFDEIFDNDYETLGVKFEPYQVQPKIHFKNGKMYVYGKVKFSVMNPLNRDIPAAYIIGYANMTIDIKVN